MNYEIKGTDSGFSAMAERPLIAGDSNAYKICCTVQEGYLKIAAKRADGTVITASGKSAVNGIAECVLSADMYAVPGKLVLRVMVVSGNSCLTIRELHTTVLEAM